jgi:hypothetical protein
LKCNWRASNIEELEEKKQKQKRWVSSQNKEIPTSANHEG